MTKTVLIVDDEDYLREAIAICMEDIGFLTRGASGGHAALEILKSTHIDLVISDIRMPEGDGIELSRSVQRDFGGKIPVILISGFSDLAPTRVGSVGALMLIQKPFAIDDLCAAAVRVLKTLD